MMPVEFVPPTPQAMKSLSSIGTFWTLLTGLTFAVMPLHAADPVESRPADLALAWETLTHAELGGRRDTK
jgi:hypothetical protein